MSSTALDRLFRRFRDRGDAGALAEVFDAVAPEMLRVARHLAPPSVQPEDLLQSTFLAAMQRASSYDPERPVKQWLLGILAKEAAHERRRGAREVEPDRLAPHAEPGPPSATEGAELAAALEAALAELPETYRAVVRPILLEGLHPREIARAAGERPGTVRVRLHRGLRLLRDALPPGLSLGALVALRSGRLAGARAEVLMEASRAGALEGPGALAAESATSAWRRLFAPRARVIAPAGAAAALIGAAAWLGGGGAGAEQPATQLARELLPAELARPPSTQTGSLRAPAALDEAPARDGAQSGASVRALGRVLGWDGQPAAAAELELDLPGVGRFTGSADARGDFAIEVELARAGIWSGILRARDRRGHADVRSVALRSDQPEVYLGTLGLGDARPLTVRVESSSGAPLAGAEVEVVLESRGLVAGVGRTGEGGALTLPAIPRGQVAVRAEHGGRAAELAGVGWPERREGIRVRLADEPSEADEPHEPHESGAPAGPAPLAGDPPPVPDVLLHLTSPAGPVCRPGADFLDASAPLKALLNADGDVELDLECDPELELGGLAPGESVLLEIAALGFRPRTQRVVLRPGGLPNPVDVFLEPCAALVASLPRAPEPPVRLELQLYDPGIGDFGPSDLDWGGLTWPNTPEGDFRFDGLLPGTYRLRERESDLCSPAIEVAAEQSLVRVELDLRSLVRVEGRVLVPDPSWLADVRVVMEAEGVDDEPNRWAPLQRKQWMVRPDEDGRFTLRLPSDRLVRLSAYHPRLVATASADLEAGEAAELGAREIVLELVQAGELELALHALALHQDLDRLRIFVYAHEPAGEPLARIYPHVEAGVARFAGVPGGTFNLWIDAGPQSGVAPLVLRGVTPEPDRVQSLPEPFFEPGARVLLRVAHARADLERVSLFARSHGTPEYVRSTNGPATASLELTGLGPGEFTVWIESPNASGTLLETELALERDGTAHLTLE